MFLTASLRGTRWPRLNSNGSRIREQMQAGREGTTSSQVGSAGAWQWRRGSQPPMRTVTPDCAEMPPTVTSNGTASPAGAPAGTQAFTCVTPA